MAVTVDQAIQVLAETPIREIQDRGYHFQPCDYYSALNALQFLEQNRDPWHGRPPPAGVKWDVDAQLDEIRTLAPISRRARQSAETPDGRTGVCSAPSGSLDSPRRHTSKAALSIFDSLKEGDVCLYDGSHVAVPAATGLVLFRGPAAPTAWCPHPHSDIFWPSDYPDKWIFERGQTWNEQHLVQAFLMYNHAFEPLVCNTHSDTTEMPHWMSCTAKRPTTTAA